ncbi:bifunctional helix-turn-helix transcriptional regulator/GNAT family N-acetyltransferase [Muricoccus radiodurans]|uniref:bifunctional helix-turn-helix transcriptional regulator/GNAT family N-acetyltransferase n=1 Tax=Muricoccus radiodurans TaxID=2231721 RepID=UPI003CEFF023
MSDTQVATIRRLSRAFTRQIGALGPLPGGDLPLTEARLLYELATEEGRTARALSQELGLDEGQVSRILARFADRDWISRPPAAADARRRPLHLTATGRAAFARLDSGARDHVATILQALPDPDRDRLAGAADAMLSVLDPAKAEPVVRPHRPGDLGWMIGRHGALYAAEWGFDARFEALVARICADFLDGHDPAREAAFLAERGGERLGSVMVVRVDDDVAKLRLLLLEPSARGMGLGRRLVRRAEDFAREAGYRRMLLWTQSCLVAARAIYAAAGWRLVTAEPNEAFGQSLVSETWERDL